MSESEPREQGSPQERLEDEAVEPDFENAQAETGYDSAEDAAKETSEEE